MLIQFLKSFNPFKFFNKRTKIPIYRPYEGPGPDRGTFLFDNEKIVFQSDKGNITFNFDDINLVTAYQIDLMVHDSVMVDIIFNENQIIRLDEGMPDFMELVYAIVNRLPHTNENWFFEVTKEVFEENFTVIYDKNSIK